MTPAIVTLEPLAGTSAAATVTVRNEGHHPLQFRFYAGDFDQTESGAHTYADAGALPHSCADRVRVIPDGVTLAPGSRTDIRVDLQATFRVPPHMP